MRGNEYVIATYIKLKVVAENSDEFPDAEPVTEHAVVIVVISADLREVYCARSDNVAVFHPRMTYDAITAPENFSVEYAEDPDIAPQMHWFNFSFPLARVDENDAIIRGFIAHALCNYSRVIEQFADDPEVSQRFGERTLATAQAARDVVARW